MSSPLLSPRPSALDRSAFVERFGDIYEHSPWVAELAWDNGLGPEHDAPAVLAEAMGEVLRNAPTQRQLEVIRAHPDLAGKAAIEQFPGWLQSVIGGTPIVLAALIAFVLNLVLPNVTLADEASEREALARSEAKAESATHEKDEETRAERIQLSGSQ